MPNAVADHVHRYKSPNGVDRHAIATRQPATSNGKLCGGGGERENLKSASAIPVEKLP